MSNSLAPRASLVSDLGFPIQMRDGTILRADIVRPAGALATPVPALLMRNPYPAIVARRQLDHLRAAEAGFAVVAQHCRGTGPSEGDFEPWTFDEGDGADTIAWIAKQPWCNGKVVSLGGSYLAHTQLMSAQTRPPQLVAMSTSITPSDPYDLTYENGALMLGSTLNWAMAQAGSKLRRAAMRGQDVRADLGEFMELAALDHPTLCKTSPLRDLPVLNRVFPFFEQWLDHPVKDDFWNKWNLRDRDALPTFIWTGWFDIFLRGTFSEFARQPRHPKTRLVIGPWSHTVAAIAFGDHFFGAAAAPMLFDLEGQQLAFLGAFARGEEPPAAPTVRVFTMIGNKWQDFDSWPPPGYAMTKYYLHPNSQLSTAEPTPDAAPANFTTNPHDPVPSLGGRNLMPGSEASHKTGPWDRSSLAKRTDILRFDTEPLVNDMEVTGELRAVFHVSTDVQDADWTAMLVDLHPDGRSYNVVDGIVRGKFSQSPPSLHEPNSIYKVEIDLVGTSWVFKAGHKLRVEVAGSNFPRYDRNPGTGQLAADAKEEEYVVRVQTVYLDKERESFVELPVKIA